MSNTTPDQQQGQSSGSGKGKRAFMVLLILGLLGFGGYKWCENVSIQVEKTKAAKEDSLRQVRVKEDSIFKKNFADSTSKANATPVPTKDSVQVKK